MTCPLSTCHHWYAADQDCTRLAEPHEDMCSEHLDRQTYQWTQFHDADECCPEHCDTNHEETTMEDAAPLTEDQMQDHIEAVRTAYHRIRAELHTAKRADSEGLGLDEVYKSFEDIKTVSRAALSSLDALRAHQEYERIEYELQQEAMAA